MFTGIVQCVATVRSAQRQRGLMEFALEVPLEISDSRVGDSFCIQGACLTAVEIGRHALGVEVSRETLARTTLGSFPPGRPVNLERALRLSDLLGGHLVTGHVDGVGKVLEVRRDQQNTAFLIQADAVTSRYLVEKGSICVDGVSLTIGLCQKDSFWVYLIPHTLASSTLRFLKPGERVNLEADIIGKYVEKLLAGRRPAKPAAGGLSPGLLEKHGFTRRS